LPVGISGFVSYNGILNETMRVGSYVEYGFMAGTTLVGGGLGAIADIDLHESCGVQKLVWNTRRIMFSIFVGNVDDLILADALSQRFHRHNLINRAEFHLEEKVGYGVFVSPQVELVAHAIGSTWVGSNIGIARSVAGAVAKDSVRWHVVENVIAITIHNIEIKAQVTGRVRVRNRIVAVYGARLRAWIRA